MSAANELTAHLFGEITARVAESGCVPAEELSAFREFMRPRIEPLARAFVEQCLLAVASGAATPDELPALIEDGARAVLVGLGVVVPPGSPPN